MKGIKTVSINPLESISQMSTGQRRAYERRLEAFISRQTRYEKGYEGTPISYAIVKQVRNAEKTLNVKRDKLFSKIATESLLVPGSDMTVEDYRNATRQYDSSSRSLKPNPKSPSFGTEMRHRDISMLKSEKDALSYIDYIKHAASDSYVEGKNRIMIDNMLKVVAQFNDPNLERRIRNLTPQQIYVLVNRTTFVESVFMHDSDPAKGQVVSGTVEHLENILDGLDF